MVTLKQALIEIKFLGVTHPEFRMQEKAEAVYTILKAETINSVTKQDLKECVKWLFDLCFEAEECE